MTKTLPFFRWFPADAETDHHYSALNDSELGFFHRCLNRAWINKGIPADMDDLARCMRVTPQYLAKVWLRVGNLFEISETDASMLVNRRQEVERAYASKKSEQASSAVRSRYGRSTGDSLRASASDSVSVSVSISGKVHLKDDLHFDRIIAAFREAGVPMSEQQISAAAMEWVSMTDSERTGAPERAEKRAREQEARFMGLPASWLRKREWLAPPVERKLPLPEQPRQKSKLERLMDEI